MSVTTTIDFGEVLDISFAAKLHSQLKDDIAAGSRVSFVSANLTRIDASCLQVLVSFISYASDYDIQVEWPELSDVIKEAADLTGLTPFLKLDS